MRMVSVGAAEVRKMKRYFRKVDWFLVARVIFWSNFFWKVAIFCMFLVELFELCFTVSVSSLVSEEVASF